MGIRFYCPNGHKLNVKEFQAGRMGICPTCGVKTRIPRESTRPSTNQEQDSPQGGAAAIATDSGSGSEAEARPAVPAMPTLPDRASEAAPIIDLNEPATGPSPAAASSAAPRIGSARAAVFSEPVDRADPLAEEGEIVWYVRPSSGGQFGPATPDIMRAWLAEGRIGADSLVWREGWRDWQTAADVFPQFSEKQPPPGDASSFRFSENDVGERSVGIAPAASLDLRLSDERIAPVSVLPAPVLRRQRQRSTQMVLIGSLALAVVVLTIVFIVMLVNR